MLFLFCNCSFNLSINICICMKNGIFNGHYLHVIVCFIKKCSVIKLHLPLHAVSMQTTQQILSLWQWHLNPHLMDDTHALFPHVLILRRKTWKSDTHYDDSSLHLQSLTHNNYIHWLLITVNIFKCLLDI